MAWDVDSRTIAEIYDYAYEQLSAWALEDLHACYAEIQAVEIDDYYTPRLNMEKYDQALLAAGACLPGDVIVDAILDFMADYRTSDNGGYKIHVCPFGCHTVDASRQED